MSDPRSVALIGETPYPTIFMQYNILSIGVGELAIGDDTVILLAPTVLESPGQSRIFSNCPGTGRYYCKCTVGPG